VPEGAVFFGEIGLSGEVRAVGQSENRLKEAQKLGFSRTYLPTVPSAKQQKPKASSGLEIYEIPHLQDLVAALARP